MPTTCIVHLLRGLAQRPWRLQCGNPACPGQAEGRGGELLREFMHCLRAGHPQTAVWSVNIVPQVRQPLPDNRNGKRRTVQLVAQWWPSPSLTCCVLCSKPFPLLHFCTLDDVLRCGMPLRKCTSGPTLLHAMLYLIPVWVSFAICFLWVV